MAAFHPLTTRTGNIEVDDRKLETAVHEAGHAVVARALGIRAGETTILPSTDQFLGHSDFDDPRFCWRIDDSNREADANNFAIALYAGAEAERLLLSKNEEFGDSIDRQIAINCLAWAGSVRGASLVGDKWFDRHEANLRKKAAGLISRHRADIERLATALLERETLSGEEVDALLAG